MMLHGAVSGNGQQYCTGRYTYLIALILGPPHLGVGNFYPIIRHPSHPPEYMYCTGYSTRYSTAWDKFKVWAKWCSVDVNTVNRTCDITGGAARGSDPKSVYPASALLRGQSAAEQSLLAFKLLWESRLSSKHSAELALVIVF